MKVIRTVREMRAAVAAARAAGKAPVALVPTMGAFHAGHRALMRRARELAPWVVVSLFVNPLQFGPAEDYGRYPRPFDEDRAQAEAEGVDVLFAPPVEEMYPDGPSRTRVTIPGMSEVLCGRARPTHFTGVLTVVAKLFNIVQPDLAVFGEKDGQQLALIRRMVQDLNFPVQVVGHPTVREAGGLALSSRNRYLDAAETERARSLYRGLSRARAAWEAGERDPARLVELVVETLAAAGV
ncbi:MAG: pantoate--beta-alanine ligase, partial [Firmicutes bacterium]|nr:pantoate--beta-alanine ligase [Bacillota bacterium]